jgi:hypothetical protein
MSDDIVTLLREDFCDFGQWENSCTPEGKCPCCLAADEIERLRAELKDADDDFHALKAMFDKMRADRDRWRKIAEQLFLWLHPSPEDDSVYEAGVEAMTMYEQAVRDEYRRFAEGEL